MIVEGIGMLAGQIAGGDRCQGLIVQALELNRKLCLSEYTIAIEGIKVSARSYD